ncbi:tripartite tricarboxylate transporter TctB family protein [Citreicella sp. C3M06]|uniref:tripartite tricarboxylate transporter TctB family protein n=1 Tax=Citreicella sp. C3M06 TaxID=2841564 RepID=UPI001C08AE6F|nr:tripartite tricarboxylate transporter TctB family protein [Citreicella sp. C3M06]MBU2960803.1 tripartite tricarboxylate transporter TctB family protein [Citreicella sp. C3M06]
MADREPLLRTGVLLPLFFLIVTTVYLAAAFDIRSQFAGAGEMSPRSVPILMACLMYVALAAVFIAEFRSPTQDGPVRELLRPLLVIVATAGYIALFRPLGYWLATLVFTSALFAIFHFQLRRPLVFAFYAIAVTALFYGLFAGIFGVRLPTLTAGVF